MKPRHFLILLGTLALLAFGGSRAEAVTFTVTNLNDSGAGSLRQAILSANAAAGTDLLVFQAGLTGTILLSQLSGPLEVTGDLTIQGPGAATLTVSGNDSVRVFAIAAGKTVTISGLTITEGNADTGGEPVSRGGGILNAGRLTLNNCTLSMCKADDGGGIYNTATLRLVNCTLQGNTTTFEKYAVGGGGLFNGSAATASLENCALTEHKSEDGGAILSYGRLTLVGCTFSGNSADRGGGIDSRDVLVASRCTFSRNPNAREGGGIYLSTAGSATLTDCALSDNRAGSGGGIFSQGSLTLTNCTLSGHDASEGSAIHSLGNLALTNSTFSGNRSTFSAAIRSEGTLAVTDCRISGNSTSKGSSGGISHGPGTGTLSRCVLSGNRGSSGGGISNSGSLTVTDCALTGNEASFGGGIRNFDSGSMTLTHCSFSGNLSRGSGGAISNSGALTASSCTFFANGAEDEGGSVWNSGAMTVRDCTVTGGGALLGAGILNKGELTAADCTLHANIALQGGGIFNRARLTLTGCTLSGNRASVGGGGLYNQAGPPIDAGDPVVGGEAILGNCTLSGNRAFEGGGLLNQGKALLANCTLFDNLAEEGDGGGLRNFSGAILKLGNTLIAGSGAGLNCVNDDAGVVSSNGHNLDSDGTCGLLDPSDQTGSPGAPLDAKLGPLQDNGGPTRTYALAPGSPAIDAGDFTLRPAETDQRGFPRIADGDRNGTALIDIGAFELSFFGTPGLHVQPTEAFLAFSTVQAQNTALPAGTEGFNLTIHYSADIAPQTFVAMLNGQNITHLFDPSTPEGFETVFIPLRAGQNRLIVRVKGKRKGKPAQDVDQLGFRVGEPPNGPRQR